MKSKKVKIVFISFISFFSLYLANGQLKDISYMKSKILIRVEEDKKIQKTLFVLSSSLLTIEVTENSLKNNSLEFPVSKDWRFLISRGFYIRAYLMNSGKNLNSTLELYRYNEKKDIKKELILKLTDNSNDSVLSFSEYCVNIPDDDYIAELKYNSKCVGNSIAIITYYRDKDFLEKLKREKQQMDK